MRELRRLSARSRFVRYWSGVIASALNSAALARSLRPSGEASSMPRWYQRFSQLVIPLQTARALAIAFSSDSTNG